MAALMALCLSPAVLGGVVKVSCDRGTRVFLRAEYTDGTFHREGQNDVNNDGIVEFAVPNQDNVKELGICKDTDGRRIWFFAKIVVGGATLVSLEPFKLPTFAAVDGGITLFARVDLEDFLNDSVIGSSTRHRWVACIASGLGKPILDW